MVLVVGDRVLWDLWCYKVAVEQGYIGIIAPATLLAHSLATDAV
jgi:hypothetical protein